MGKDRALSHPLALWCKLGEDSFSLLPLLGTEGTHKLHPFYLSVKAKPLW